MRGKIVGEDIDMDIIVCGRGWMF